MSSRFIEVVRPTGGFAFYPTAKWAVSVVETDLLVKGCKQKDIDNFVVFLQAIQDSGLMRTLKICTGHTFKTGR